MSRRVKGRLAALAGAAVAVVAMSAGPASAHAVTIEAYGLCGGLELPWTLCGTSSVSSSHLTVYATDKNADGYGAWVYWKRANGSTGVVKDPNGSASGAGSHYGTSPVTEMQYCGVPSGGIAYCGAWKGVG
ncbi:hypothetical protein [Streptomyces sp. NPDC001930]|uniref:hypothetical protein n=1 Tax=Streptomyces sp. NPDC001930 TaxID=3364625 RepID=UPI0036871FDF